MCVVAKIAFEFFYFRKHPQDPSTADGTFGEVIRIRVWENKMTAKSRL